MTENNKDIDFLMQQLRLMQERHREERELFYQIIEMKVQGNQSGKAIEKMIEDKVQASLENENLMKQWNIQPKRPEEQPYIRTEQEQVPIRITSGGF
ncbi:MAG: hypothetical protein K0U39_09340 [Alphaproteobacteria bacterium]|nr:hypothetical protein [Alphaproteobacteria bacterium]